MKLIKFSATWCAPCKMFAPIVNAVVAETGIEYQEVDIDENRALTEKYNIQTVPTVIIENNGVIVFNYSGVMSKAQLKSHIASL